MGVVRSLVIAFAMYSKIPMPKVDWKKENMRFVLCFLPLVGAVLGLLWYLLFRLLIYIGAGTTARACLLTALPILLSGGIHVDGYMDTMDALHSYKSREDKLKILKDPHIGAFSVIMVILYYLLFIGFASELGGVDDVILAGSGFVISRVFSGLMVVYLKPAKGDGMLKYFSDTAGKIVVTFSLVLELVLLNVLVSILVSPVVLIETAVAVIFIAYYKYKTYKEFGGVTGDTAGYFVTICELLTCMTVVVAGVI